MQPLTAAMTTSASLANLLASLPEAQRAKALQSLTPEERRRTEFLWEFWARPKQIAPAGVDWSYWLLLAGRGFGKTRTGAEWIRKRVKGGAKHLIFAGATAGDLRDIMIEGESGILAISPENERPHYEPSKSRLTWPGGAKAMLLSADEPERFRGKQSDTIWADETASWRYPEAWDQLMFGFRLGDAYGVVPQAVISTTPRPTPLIRGLLKDPRARVTTGSTYENRTNLAETYISGIVQKYEGTRLGRQELYAEILDDSPGALWKRDNLDEHRRTALPGKPKRIVVAIDPAVTSAAGSDETGIIVAAIGQDGHGYVLDDLSGKFSPSDWARRAIAAYHHYEADRIVAEVNNGGDMVELTLRTHEPNIPFTAVHASKSKQARAEPIAALYEQGRCHHVGLFPALEDQQCTWDPMLGDRSPDRIDAMVWAFTNLMLSGSVPSLKDFRAFQANAPQRRF